MIGLEILEVFLSQSCQHSVELIWVKYQFTSVTLGIPRLVMLVEEHMPTVGDGVPCGLEVEKKL